MKSVTLALVTLLALGCQAAPLQANAPDPLQNYKQQAQGILFMTIQQIKARVDQIADQETKDMIKEGVGELQKQIMALHTQVRPMADAAVQTLTEASADLRASLTADMEALKAEVEPMRNNLKEVVDNHMAQYKKTLEPLVEEYNARKQDMMAELKAKFEPVMAELRTSVPVHVEETKGALMPIIEAVRGKIGERLENVKEMATPYVEEYKGQLVQAYQTAQKIDHQEFMAGAKPAIDKLGDSLKEFAKSMQDLMPQ